MFPNKPVIFHVLYILIPTVSIIGNGFIVYVTFRSRELRRPCSILIATVSLSDMMLVSSSLATTIFHNIVQKNSIPLTACIYLQLASLFATCSSPMLLLSLAFDRLLSLMILYQPLITSHSRLYTMAQLLPGCVLGVTIDVYILVHHRQERDVICLLASPMQGKIMEIYTKLAIVVCILIILCYGCFIFCLKKIRTKSEAVKNLYRSVIIISLSFVFGYFSTVVILFANTILHLNIDTVILNQTAGTFLALATSSNFFIYYGISNEYRKVFDKFLGIGRLKQLFVNKQVLCAQHAVQSSAHVLSRHAISEVV